MGIRLAHGLATTVVEMIAEFPASTEREREAMLALVAERLRAEPAREAVRNGG
jgi:hypothetical protein